MKELVIQEFEDSVNAQVNGQGFIVLSDEVLNEVLPYYPVDTIEALTERLCGKFDTQRHREQDFYVLARGHHKVTQALNSL
jgi:hypothetical protein